MSIQDIDPELVREQLAIHKQMLREAGVGIAVDRGPFHDTVLYYSAAFAATAKQKFDDAVLVLDADRLASDPNAADNRAVDSLAANWLVTRRPGSLATGTVIVRMTKKIPLVLQAGYVLTSATGVAFKTISGHAIRTGDSNLLNGDILLTKVGEHYEFRLPVIAVSPGRNGNVRRATLFRLSTNLPPAVTTVTAADTFTGGSDDEDNAALLKRAKAGGCDKSLSNRKSIAALVHSVIPTTIDVSVIGFGDEEQTRGPNSVDVYVKVSGDPQNDQALADLRAAVAEIGPVCDIQIKPAAVCLVSARVMFETPSRFSTRAESAVRSYIDGLGFGVPVTVARLMAVAQAAVPADDAVLYVELKAVLKCPDGTEKQLNGDLLLSSFAPAAKMVSGRTVCFFADDISTGVL